MKISRLHKLARDYAGDRLLAVFPCLENGKAPACEHGVKEATLDLKQIDLWWRGNSKANIGCDVHQAGYCVIDAEAQADPEFLKKLPETYTVQTPGGGAHYWFEGELPNTVKKLAPHVDSRGGMGDRPGYVLLPGSIINGVAYKVLKDVPVAPLPGWIKEALTTARVREAKHQVTLDNPDNIAKARTYLRNLAPVVEGQGSDAKAYEVACKMRDLGLTESTALVVMMEDFRCVPKDFEWVQTKCRNAYSYGQNAPGADSATAQDIFGNALAKLRKDVPPPSTKSKLISIRGDQVKMEKVEWFWPNRFPNAMCSLIAGHGGLGKTTVLLSMAAAVSTGGAWPNNEGTAPKGSIIYFSAEDTPEHTLMPRYVAAGGDPTKIHFVRATQTEEGGRRTFNLATDLAELEKMLDEIQDVRVAFFDPISSYFGNADTYKNSEVRSVLEPVSELAARRRIACINNTHLAKGAKGTANMRVLDSVAVTAVARAIAMVLPSADDRHKRVFVPSKANLGPEPDALTFGFASKTVSDDGVTGSCIVWGGPVTMSADEAFAAVEEKSKRTPALEEAIEFVRQYLISGPKLSVEVYSAAENHGHSNATVRRAIKSLKLIAEKSDPDAGYVMRLPEA